MAIFFKFNHYKHKTPHSFDDIELSFTTRFWLKKNGINNVNELLEYSESDLRRLKYIGPIARAEIKDGLAKFGLALKENVNE